MSRSGYMDDCFNDFGYIQWRGRVAAAIKGKRGQRLLVDLVKALDAMPEKRLIANELETPTGEVCALGAVGRLRGIDMNGIDPENNHRVAKEFDIAYPLACEITFLNDEWVQYREETPEARWRRMREWALHHIQPVIIPGTEMPDDV